MHAGRDAPGQRSARRPLHAASPRQTRLWRRGSGRLTVPGSALTLTSVCRQHVREPLPRRHHFWILFQISKILPDSDGAIILGRGETAVSTQAWLPGTRRSTKMPRTSRRPGRSSAASRLSPWARPPAGPGTFGRSDQSVASPSVPELRARGGRAPPPSPQPPRSPTTSALWDGGAGRRAAAS